MWTPSHWFYSAAATPTLTWTDSEDGTGGTATIAGSSDGATNTVYAASFTGATGAVSWTSVGSRTGNGNVSVSLSKGHYILYVKSTLGLSTADSASYYANASDATTDALEYRLAEAIQTRLRSLTMTDIESGDVVVREVPTEQNLDPPCIVVAPERPIPSGGTNQRDDVGYGFYIAIIAADNQALAANLSKYTRWLDQMRRAFINQRLSAVSESVICRCEPINTIPYGDWMQNLFAGGMILRCVCRQTRGLT